MLEASRVPIPGPSWVTPDSALPPPKGGGRRLPAGLECLQEGPELLRCPGNTEARRCPPSLMEAEATVYKHLGSAGMHSASPSASGRRLTFCSSPPCAGSPSEPRSPLKWKVIKPHARTVLRVPPGTSGGLCHLSPRGEAAQPPPPPPPHGRPVTAPATG